MKYPIYSLFIIAAVVVIFWVLIESILGAVHG